MSEDIKVKAIRAVLRRHPEGIGFNELRRQLQGEVSLNTLAARLHRLQDAQIVTFKEGRRRSKIYALTENSERIDAYWLENYLRFEHMVDFLADTAKDPGRSTKDKLVTAGMIFQQEVTHTLLRQFFLKQKASLIEPHERAEELHGILVESHIHLLEKFIASLKPPPTDDEYNQVLKFVGRLQKDLFLKTMLGEKWESVIPKPSVEEDRMEVEKARPLADMTFAELKERLRRKVDKSLGT